jgi:hypothetical protein
VVNSFGEENTGTGFFDILQNSAPVADFSCSSNIPDSISCSSLSTDVDNNIVSYNWVIDGTIYSGQQLSNIQIGGTSDSVVVFHKVDDTFVSSEISKEITVLRNTPPQLSISCVNVKPFVINCNSLVSDAENTPYQMAWYFNGELVGNGKELNNAIFYGEEVNIIANLTDEFGLSAQASLAQTLELPDLTPSIYCKNIENQILDCAQVSTLIKPDETTYSWTINEELVSSRPAFEIPYDISNEIRVDLTITTLNKTFSSSAVIRPLSTPPSPVNFLLANDDTFLPVETNLSLQVSGGDLKLGEGIKAETLAVEVNEQSISLDNQIDVINGFLNVPVTLEDGVNIVTVSSLDSMNREVSSTFTLFAGSRVISITNQLGSSGEIALFFPELNDLVVRKELNETAVIENVPNQRFLISLLGDGVQIKEVFENETEVLFGDQAIFQTYNTSNLDLLGGLEGWELLRGSYDFVDLGVSRFQADLNGEFELLKTHLVTEEEHIGFPISYNSQGKELKFYVLYENLTKNELTYKAFDERDLYDNINQSAFSRFFGSSFEIGDKIKIHLYLKEKNNALETTVLNHSFLDHLVDIAFAQAEDTNNQINLGPIQTKGFLVTNARLLDGTGSGKGEGLYTIPSAPFSPSYPPSLPDGGPSFDPINGVDHYRFYTAQVSFNFFDPDELYGEHKVSLLADNQIIGEAICFLTKKNVCPIRLFEKDLNITSPFVGLSLSIERFGLNLDIDNSQRIILPEEISRGSFYIGNTKKFRVLASLTGYLSQNQQPIYRYDPEKQNEIDEGMKDWVLRSHLGLFSQLLNRSPFFRRKSDYVSLPPRFSDLSFLGSTKKIIKRDEHARKPSHHGGLDADIRFVEGAQNEVGTSFYRGSDKESSKYLSDFNAILSILNDQYDSISQIFIQNEALDKKKFLKDKYEALNNNPGNVLLDNMAASCIRNQPALEKIKSLEGHKNHFHIRFYDYLEEGRFNTDDPNGQLPIVPEAVAIVSESKVVNLGNYFIKEHLLNPELVNNENKERVRFYYRDNFSQTDEGWRTVPYGLPSKKSAFYIVNSGSGFAIRPNYSGIDNASGTPNDKEKLSAYDRIVKARRYFYNGQPNTIDNLAPESPINLSMDSMNVDFKVVVIDDTGTSCSSREFSLLDQVPCDQARGYLPYLSNGGTQKSCKSVLYKVRNITRNIPTPEQESEYEAECVKIKEYCSLNSEVTLACDSGAYLSYTTTYSLLCADGERSATVTGGYQLSCDSYGNRERQDFPLSAYHVGCGSLQPTTEEFNENPRHFINVPQAIGEGFSFTFDSALSPSLIDLMLGQ